MSDKQEYKQVRQTTDRETSQPRERIPFGVPRAKLGVSHEIPGYKLRWINDIPGNLFQALDGSWEFAQKNEVGIVMGVVSNDGNLGDKICRLVGTQKNGEPCFAYLMKIKNELYDQDRAELAEAANRQDSSIRGANHSVPGMDGRNFYVPQHTPIKLNTKFQRKS